MGYEVDSLTSDIFNGKLVFGYIDFEGLELLSLIFVLLVSCKAADVVRMQHNLTIIKSPSFI